MEKRFFVDKESLLENIVTLTEEENNHLSKVLRLRVGDTVECFFDGSDILKCEILEVGKNASKLRVLSSEPCLQNPKTDLTLFQALPKLDKLEFVCQKLTELGASQIVPFESKFCIAKKNENKTERLNKIIVSACKQCGRTSLLKVLSPLSFDQMLENLTKFDKVVFACEFGKKGVDLLSCLTNFDLKGKKVAYIIGSEGGFGKSEAERISSLKNVVTINLGQRILRTETASVAIGAIIQSVMGEF